MILQIGDDGGYHQQTNPVNQKNVDTSLIRVNTLNQHCWLIYRAIWMVSTILNLEVQRYKQEAETGTVSEVPNVLEVASQPEPK